MTGSRYVSVQPPPAHEGVGRALRVAYLSKGADIPDDMVELLTRLDRL